jgi:pimeloyl-ACP methyl ester carboxylesterase
MSVHSRTLIVDGIRTHYLEAGDGPPVVLLAGGEFGGSAELAWEQAIPALAERYRVIAPDWLGYGGSAKLYDFDGGTQRRLWHMTRLLETLAIERAAFVGSSMGGTLLAKVAASTHPAWPIEVMVLVSGGGFVPLNEARRLLVDYDGSFEAMRAMVRVIFHDQRFAEDDAHVERRHRASLLPGAWEAVAAARLKSPAVPGRDELIGQPDTTPYELIDVPTLIIAGANDQLREPGYADELQARIRRSRLEVFDGCGHVPHLEHPDSFNRLLLAYLREVLAPGKPETATATVGSA